MRTEYILEFYHYGARKPYRTVRASLPHGEKPHYTSSDKCFNQALSHALRAKVRYAKTGKLAATKVWDRYGNGYLRWHRQ